MTNIESKLYQYTGTKSIKATPMGYNEFALLVNRPQKTEDREGYLVVYGLEGNDVPNVEGINGYTSWSPKEAFEKAYKPSETFLERVKIEYEELITKTKKLFEFIKSPKFSNISQTEQTALHKQYDIMVAYCAVLEERLKFYSNN